MARGMLGLAAAVLCAAFGTELRGEMSGVFQWTDPERALTWTFTMSEGRITLGGGQSGMPAIPANTTGTVVVPERIGAHPVVALADFAFEACRGIARIELPTSMETLGSYAFLDCSSLASVSLNEGLGEIGGYAFCGCSSLSAVSLPASVRLVGDRALIRCESLQAIDVSGENERYRSENGILYDKEGRVLITCPAGMAGSVCVREGTEILTTEAFAGCVQVSEVKLPSTLKDIGYGAFSGCSALKELVVPDGVEKIGMYAFIDCSGLYRLNIPESVQWIGSGAFTCCDALTDYWQDGMLVIDGVVAACAFGTAGALVVPDGSRMIASGAFFQGQEIESVEIPASVTMIGDDAFAFCGKLKAIVFRGDAPTVRSEWQTQRTAIYRGSESVTNFVRAAAKGWKTVENESVTTWPAEDDSARPVVILDSPDGHKIPVPCDHVVTTAADAGPGSLREALGQAQDGALILFDLPTGENVIVLSSSLTTDAGRFGAQGLTIGGDNGGRGVTIRGDGTFQLMKIGAGNRINADGLTFEDGYGFSGGAIENRGALTVRQCRFFRNQAKGWGGAICNMQAASLYVQKCLFAENRCESWGGAIASHTTPLTTVLECRFTDNASEAWGGAIAGYGAGDVLVIASKVEGNSAHGGSIVVHESTRLTLIGTTVRDNESVLKSGSAVYNLGGTVNAVGSFCDSTYGSVSGTTDLEPLRVTPSVLAGAETRAVGGWYSPCTNVSGMVSLRLNELARPQIGTRDDGGQALNMAETDMVSMRVENVKPCLYYGLGWSDTPGGEFHVEPELWIQADENGNLSSEVKAPKGKSASRFFRVKVTDDLSCVD